jgi:hypothetical protein
MFLLWCENFFIKRKKLLRILVQFFLNKFLPWNIFCPFLLQRFSVRANFSDKDKKLDIFFFSFLNFIYIFHSHVELEPVFSNCRFTNLSWRLTDSWCPTYIWRHWISTYTQMYSLLIHRHFPRYILQTLLYLLRAIFWSFFSSFNCLNFHPKVIFHPQLILSYFQQQDFYWKYLHEHDMFPFEFFSAFLPISAYVCFAWCALSPCWGQFLTSPLYLGEFWPRGEVGP